MADSIKVEVVHARPDRQVLLQLQVPTGTTVIEAIEQSGIRASFPDLELIKGGVGIFSAKVPLNHVLREGDRVEIYRPLIADPKESRRRRAEKAASE
jgi:putative ubiquitin-RnfH superfamily antitoxin RatB of RatAB toxin-antitoxin module